MPEKHSPREKVTFKEKVVETWEKSKPTIIKTTKWVIGIGMTIGVVVLVSKNTQNDEANSDDVLNNDNIDYKPTSDNGNNNISDDSFTPHEPRYKVEYKAFKTGEWYTKTETDNIGGAYSVASDYNSFGRAYRLNDTLTGKVLKEADEDAGMAETHGYPNGYPW